MFLCLHPLRQNPLWSWHLINQFSLMATMFLPQQQRVDANAPLFDFLQDGAEGSELCALNEGTFRGFAALISMPNTTKVRVVYALLGFGTASIGQVFPINGKLLALYGEGGDMGIPPILLLPRSICNTQEVKNPSYADVVTVFQSNHTLGMPTHQANQITAPSTQSIMSMAPIPPYFVFLDGFNDYLEAAIVYEKLCVSD